MSFPVASQFAWRNRRLTATSGDRDAGLPARAYLPGLTVADLGVLAGRPAWTTTAAGSADPVCGHHASCEETMRPLPGKIVVQLYDIK